MMSLRFGKTADDAAGVWLIDWLVTMEEADSADGVEWPITMDDIIVEGNSSGGSGDSSWGWKRGRVR